MSIKHSALFFIIFKLVAICHILFLFHNSSQIKKMYHIISSVPYFFICLILLKSITIMDFFTVASAVLQGGLFGIIGKFSARYITAVVSGQALGGIFTAVAEIVSLWLGASSTTSAFVYFMVANGMFILSLLSYLILSRAVSIVFIEIKLLKLKHGNIDINLQVFFKYHMRDKPEAGSIQYETEVAETTDRPVARELSYKAILRKVY